MPPMTTHPSSLRDGIRASVFSILGIEKTTHSPEAVLSIRQAMLQALGPQGTHENPALHHRILRTEDAVGLWFARAELYGHLSRTLCEPVAQARVRSLTPLFEGQVSANLMGVRKGCGAPTRTGNAI
jgi:hypothetical protein